MRESVVFCSTSTCTMSSLKKVLVHFLQASYLLLCYICIRQMAPPSLHSIGQADSFVVPGAEFAEMSPLSANCEVQHRHVTASRHSVVLM